MSSSVGGSAGSVLASRLSARSALACWYVRLRMRRQTMCQRELSWIRIRARHISTRGSIGYAQSQHGSCIAQPRPKCPCAQTSKIRASASAGGGSSINGQMANRGAPSKTTMSGNLGAHQAGAGMTFFRILKSSSATSTSMTNGTDRMTHSHPPCSTEPVVRPATRGG